MNKTMTFTEIPLTAAIMATLNVEPVLNLLADGRGLVRFSFPGTDQVQEVALRWSEGSLVVNGRQYERHRSDLYRRVRSMLAGR